MLNRDDLCIHQIFEEQAVKFPDLVALKLGDDALTYRELNQRADQLANRLRALGVGPESIVAVYLERSFELLIGILGALKAGGAYLPIDPAYPQDRMKFMLEDSRAAVLLTRQTMIANFQLSPITTVNLDEVTAMEPAFASDRRPQNNPTPESLAYVIYTSGSTGKPKGVMVTHHNVVRLFKKTDHWFGFNSQDVWTLFHSSAFDFSVWEIWGALLYGGQLVIVPYMISRSPETFYDLLSREKVTVLNQTPSAFRQLIRVEQAAPQPKPLALRYVIFGGEALEMSLLKPWFERHGDQAPQLVNMYGITETTVHVTYRPLTKADTTAGSVIGVPIPDLELYIFDAQGDPSPVGEIGELFVGGPGLARGYLNRPELTAERFIVSNASENPGKRLYRTGDLARRLPNHDIEYMGRIDQQVKIRGFRIELGEIEAALGRQASVSEAVVLAQEDTPGDKRLVAYLIVRGGGKPSLSELRTFLRTQLPEYMVPTAFYFVEKFPLNNNGKLDRGALQMQASLNPPATDVPAAGFVVGNALEKQIHDLWQEILRGVTVGLDDNFFDLGGDSLLLAQIHTRLQVMLAREFPITDMFAHPTVRSLATHLQGEEAGTKKTNVFLDRARRQRKFA